MSGKGPQLSASFFAKSEGMLLNIASQGDGDSKRVAVDIAIGYVQVSIRQKKATEERVCREIRLKTNLESVNAGLKQIRAS